LSPRKILKNGALSAGSDRDADEAAIRALLDRQIQSWDAGDPIAYASAYAREGDCVSFLGSHYRGREAIAASCEVPRADSLFKRLLRGVRLNLEITHLRFLTPDVVVVHATCGATKGARPSRRNLRTNTSVAVRTADGWLLAASQNTTLRPLAERLASKLVA
jgi:uncharacterized protein (TIGR02246 family)